MITPNAPKLQFAAVAAVGYSHQQLSASISTTWAFLSARTLAVAAQIRSWSAAVDNIFTSCSCSRSLQLEMISCQLQHKHWTCSCDKIIWISQGGHCCQLMISWVIEPARKFESCRSCCCCCMVVGIIISSSLQCPATTWTSVMTIYTDQVWDSVYHHRCRAQQERTPTLMDSQIITTIIVWN